MTGHPLITPQHLTRAAEARLLVAISFHFVKNRLGFLETELKCLAAFPVAKRDIVVFTNATDPAEQDAIRQVFRKAGLVDAFEPRLEAVTGLPHPYELTWAHKSLIPRVFLAPDSPYSHFIYLEDDLGLTFEGFAYFLAAREFLRPFDNLVPGFLRTEWSAQRACLTNTDHNFPVKLASQPFILAGDYAFLAAENPYWAGFILDQELGREYAHSRSFHFKRSRAVSREMVYYGVRERAVMGLTFENPPAPFAYRVVVPVSIASRMALPCALVPHLPNNYVDDPRQPAGKIAMTDLFVGQLDPAKEVVLAEFNSAKQRKNRSKRRRHESFRAMRHEIRLNIMDVLRQVKRSIFGPAAPKRE